jgi:hypothetical protein
LVHEIVHHGIEIGITVIILILKEPPVFTIVLGVGVVEEEVEVDILIETIMIVIAQEIEITIHMEVDLILVVAEEEVVVFHPSIFNIETAVATVAVVDITDSHAIHVTEIEIETALQGKLEVIETFLLRLPVQLNVKQVKKYLKPTKYRRKKEKKMKYLLPLE